jgi:hypothetical protein
VGGARVAELYYAILNQPIIIMHHLDAVLFMSLRPRLNWLKFVITAYRLTEGFLDDNFSMLLEAFTTGIDND